MFSRLFAASGLSLDRLRALVEVGAAGSMVKAASQDPVRQSQLSRQIKELEDFFQVRLLERQGKGIRLTPSGRELARISRFFLLGLSNFQRGCLAESQTFRIGTNATFAERFLLPLLAAPRPPGTSTRYTVETVAEDEIERRLHDLTLDFGVVAAESVSRPLQLREVGTWRLRLWVPEALCLRGEQAARAFSEGRLPLALALRELPPAGRPGFETFEPALTCQSFLEARVALEQQGLAAVLPDFLEPRQTAGPFHEAPLPAAASALHHYRLAWNPRLLRLNAHAVRQRDSLLRQLAAQAATAMRPTRTGAKSPARG